jgi:hypothetical protein
MNEKNVPGVANNSAFTPAALNSSAQQLREDKAKSNEGLKVSLDEFKTIEEVFKTQREKNKLDLETLSILAKLEGKEKLSPWEKLRTIIPWLGVIGTLIISIITYNYQKEKDRTVIDKERVVIEQKQQQEKSDKENRELKENEQKEKERKVEREREEALLRSQSKDMEEARRYRDAEHREHEKDREEVRAKRAAELQQLLQEREGTKRQELAAKIVSDEKEREAARALEQRELNRKSEDIDKALNLIGSGASPVAGINKLAFYGVETLPFIINEISIDQVDKENLNWSRSFAAIGAIKRLGIEKLTDAERMTLKKRAYDSIEELDVALEFLSAIDNDLRQPPRKSLNDVLKTRDIEPKQYRRKITDARFTWQILFEIVRMIEMDEGLQNLIDQSCREYLFLGYRQLRSPICPPSR